MNKDKIKEKILKDGEHQYLSAQEYKTVTDGEKTLMKEVLKDEGKDADDYERNIKALWPKKFTPKPLTWRR